MKNNTFSAQLILCALMLSLCLFSCEKKKEGKVIVTETEYYLVMDGNYSSSLNAKGKIRNVGEVDVRNVAVTGDCKSCGEAMVSGQWFVTRAEAKREDQKSIIPYLAAGAEANFDFQGIAYFYIRDGQPPENNPERLEVYIESFETVN
jgi:hypothetical protein